MRRAINQSSWKGTETTIPNPDALATLPLDAITKMLAMESVPSKQTHSWNVGMKRLRAKSELTRQLFHQLAALEPGRDTAELRLAWQRAK
jgi:hypothetical protein